MASRISEDNVKEKVLEMAIEAGLYSKDGVYPEAFIVKDEFGKLSLVCNRGWCDNDFVSGIVKALIKFVAEKPEPLADWKKPEVEQALETLRCAFANPLK